MNRWNPIVRLKAWPRWRHRVLPIIFPLPGQESPGWRRWRALFWFCWAALFAVGVIWPNVAERKSTPVIPVATIETGSLLPGTRFRDCPDDTLCPWMRVLPAGDFLMGSPESEAGRSKAEGPQRSVTIAYDFAVMEAEVTRGQFARFAAETKYKPSADCDWTKPGFEQTDIHPVVCISWDDAHAYANWLSSKAGQVYRLLHEAEWEYAARAGKWTRWSFGDDEAQLCGHANVANGGMCSDGYEFTAPGKAFKANAWGLHDMHGNAWEWVADCWHDNYDNAPPTGDEWAGNCTDLTRVVRGGGWGSIPQYTRSASRGGDTPDYRYYITGFRLARTLSGPQAEGPLPNPSRSK